MRLLKTANDNLQTANDNLQTANDNLDAAIARAEDAEEKLKEAEDRIAELEAGTAADVLDPIKMDASNAATAASEASTGSRNGRRRGRGRDRGPGDVPDRRRQLGPITPTMPGIRLTRRRPEAGNAMTGVWHGAGCYECRRCTPAQG